MCIRDRSDAAGNTVADERSDTISGLAQGTFLTATGELKHDERVKLGGVEIKLEALEIAAAAKQYRVYYKKVPDEKNPGAYSIDHSALIYLMGPDGAYVAHFPHATNPDALAERLAKLL